MAKKKEDRFPLQNDPDHKHIWDKWYPFSNKEKYRVCLHPQCRLTQRREVK